MSEALRALLARFDELQPHLHDTGSNLLAEIHNDLAAAAAQAETAPPPVDPATVAAQGVEDALAALGVKVDALAAPIAAIAAELGHTGGAT
ncbi:hypothetical protein [Pandoraea norimbergensis]|uniref:Uncharacterized protein n=1 Tax=Pandoraea norimbergensis TaxID=93219 RepID=A0ABN4JPX7_9BURK|nr:hypothetical protein [Pandoraea norimbergensis]ALS61860.1 hypothetical protein AT302_20835 [Pandoraea norimbergensis]